VTCSYVDEKEQAVDSSRGTSYLTLIERIKEGIPNKQAIFVSPEVLGLRQ
jgi:hypothetical protein